MMFAPAAHAVDPETDFGGYMDEMQARERDAVIHAAKLQAHEEWRQNTWGGWTVRQFQAFGGHVAPFVMSIMEAANEEGTALRVITHVGARMLVVAVGLLVIYSFLRAFQLVVGTDVTVVEEIVIVHEYDTEEEAAKARAASSRGKKQKTSKEE